MPGSTAAEHYTQAQRNWVFYEAIGGSHSENPEWAMTVLFYAALHEVEAALRSLNEPDSRTHDGRRLAVRTRLQAVAAEYDQLEAMSKKARYYGKRYSQSDLAFAKSAPDRR